MKKLNNIEKAEFEQINKNVAKILIHTMNTLDIPNYIESMSICDGYRYKLRFDKEKI